MKLSLVRARLRPAALAVPHWVAVTAATLLSTFVGAAGGYLETVPTSEWLQLKSPSSAVPLIVGAGVAGTTALLSQAVLLIKQWAASQAVPQPPEQS